MKPLTVFGGRGFVGSAYINLYYHHAIGNIASINSREDYDVYSEDVLYMISTVHNYHVFTDTHLDINTNLNLLMTVLDNWRRYQEKNNKRGTFNFISSWSVYGNQKSLPVSEDAPCDPKGLYIITKRCAEQLLVSYCQTFKLNYRILRMGNVVGPGDKPSAQKNVLQHTINQLARNENVTLFGDGKFYRDFIHIDDAARAIELVIRHGDLNQIFNIGNGETWEYGTIIEFARLMLNSSGHIVYKEPTQFQKEVPVSSFYMNVKKIKNLGFKSEYTGAKLYGSLVPKG